MGTLSVRTLDPERELDPFVALFNQAGMGTLSRERWLANEARAAGHGLRRALVGEQDGRIVAAAGLADEGFAPNCVTCWIVTDAAHRRRGHGRAMVAAVEEVLAVRRPDEVRTRVRDDDAESRAWAERRGFTLLDHTFRSRLDLEAFDPSAHRDAVRRAEAAGLRFRWFGPDDDPDRLYELFARLSNDVPDHLQAPDRAYFQREIVEQAGVRTLLACDGDAAVGLATLVPRNAGEYLNALTGVLPAYRGRGLARALKVVSAEAATAAGCRSLLTGNNARNAAMLAVNDALGYRREVGVYHLHRLTAPPDRMI